MINSDEPAQLVLASKSPRRRELLDQIAVKYVTKSVAIDETPRQGESAEALVIRLAKEKAAAGWAFSNGLPALGSDTVVVCDDEIFGKPTDESDARRMLSALSGREHRVITAVSVCAGPMAESVLSESKVRFRRLTQEEITAYWRSGEPADKAGAYAIQGKAAVFIVALSGSFSGVMGLPLAETADLLLKFNIDYWSAT